MRRSLSSASLCPPVLLPFPSLKYARFIGTTSSAYRPSSAAAAPTAPPSNHRAVSPCSTPAASLGIRNPRSNLHCHHLLYPSSPGGADGVLAGFVEEEANRMAFSVEEANWTATIYRSRDLEQPCDFWQNPASFHEVFIVIVVIIFIIIPVFVHSFGSFSFGMVILAVICLNGHIGFF
ncbi:hypothetical protein ACMD2_24278 [Ananas comosus]|uniref:Uncharacterized protein n=1 Tax=Ananas comosus TaxID=4615 RepID=A0A199VCJ9_ANACO|nr:hypothetical protein ACMD2_24278 [Ananas comosus]